MAALITSSVLGADPAAEKSSPKPPATKSAPAPKHKAAPAFTDPKEAGTDYELQGEFVGKVDTSEGQTQFGAQVIAMGDGKFHLVGYHGGLPGAGWDKTPKIAIDAQQAAGKARATASLTHDGEGFTAVITPDEIAVFEAQAGTNGQPLAKLAKVHRQSPTLGAQPPAGAVVLFDGTTPDNFEGGRMTPDHLLMEGATSKQKFQNFTLHVEFCLSLMPTARGQGRSNSGCYCQDRYEVQILDSFGLEGVDNECGGIYKVSAPAVNMCLPPLAWQTYDIDFAAAEFKDGKKVHNARVTVRHNGVVVQDNVEVPHATTAAHLKEGPEPGPIYLQNHGNNLVRFRNVWAVVK
jgi:hypothetical protein